MTEKKSVMDIAEESLYDEQKAVRDDVAEIAGRLRRSMDAGLTPDEMRVVSAEKKAADAASEILSKILL